MHTTFALLNLLLIFGAAAISMQAYFSAHSPSAGAKGSKLLSSRVRAWYFSNLDPFEDWLVRLRVSPAALSWSQLVLSVGVGIAYAAGLLYTAGFLLLFTGTLDILDGKVARRSGGGTPAGAYLDSVIDRYAELTSMIGLLVYFHSGWQVWAVLFALVGGMTVSYSRARAEGLGVSCDVGWLQRPERFVILGFGSIFTSLSANLLGTGNLLLEITIVLLAVLSNATALQRARHSYLSLRAR